MNIFNIETSPSAQVYKINRKISKRKLAILFSECSEKKIGNNILNKKKHRLIVKP